MDKAEILDRVSKVNDQLLKGGLSIIEIENFWNDCFETAKNKNNHHFEGFKKSLNAEKLSKKLNDSFGLKFQPKIKRHINNQTGVKFLMKTTDNQVYEFKGTVLDFLSYYVKIELSNKTFIIK
jgi:hypothetical protein